MFIVLAASVNTPGTAPAPSTLEAGGDDGEPKSTASLEVAQYGRGRELMREAVYGMRTFGDVVVKARLNKRSFVHVKPLQGYPCCPFLSGKRETAQQVVVSAHAGGGNKKASG